jgi:putative tricarboxylic transport membrane protein
MILRRDHIAGGAFVLAGALVYALSGDLPWGSMAMPGAGMMPKLAIGLMIAFGFVLVARAGESPPLAEVRWTDLPHAALVVLVAGAAAWLYTRLGFLLTVSLLLFTLVFAVERKNIVRAAAFSIGVTVLAYLLFGMLLKAPLPRGLIERLLELLFARPFGL